MDLSVFFCGTAASAPSARRGLPAVLVRRGGDWILFDCGEGTQRQLLRSVGLHELSEIYITHMHADHWLGLPGLLKTFDLFGREKPLTVHGPPGLQELAGTVIRAAGRTSYELRLVELDHDEVLDRGGYSVAPIPVFHRGPAYGYVVREPVRPGVFDPVRAQKLGLTPGPEFGRVQRGETIRGVAPADVMGPERSGRTLVYSGDSRPCDALQRAAAGADLLIHEATFLEEDAAQAHAKGHATAAQAARLAAEAGVRCLALVHTSRRYPTRAIKAEARAIFEPTWVPRDFDTIELPFAEHGEPTLTHWEPAAAAGPDPEAPAVRATC